MIFSIQFQIDIIFISTFTTSKTMQGLGGEEAKTEVNLVLCFLWKENPSVCLSFYT